MRIWKRGYFRLLSDNMISEIIPHAVFNPEDDTYDLHLKIKMENEFSVRVGGKCLRPAPIRFIWDLHTRT